MDFKLLASLSNEKLEEYKLKFKDQPTVVATIQGMLDTRKKLEEEADKSIGQALQAQAEVDDYEQKLIKGLKTMPKDCPAGVQNAFYRRVAKMSKDKDGKDVEELLWSVEVNHSCKKAFDKDGKPDTSDSKKKGKLAVEIFEQITQPMLESNGQPKKDTEGKIVMVVVEKSLGEFASIRAFCDSIKIENHGASARQDLANNTLGRQFRIQNLS